MSIARFHSFPVLRQGFGSTRGCPLQFNFTCNRKLRCSSEIHKEVNSCSIVGGLLDYLNESWTQFHATGIIFI